MSRESRLSGVGPLRLGGPPCGNVLSGHTDVIYCALTLPGKVRQVELQHTPQSSLYLTWVPTHQNTLSSRLTELFGFSGHSQSKMGRQEAIARSIVLALISSTRKRSRSAWAWIIALFSAFFSLYQLRFEKVRPTDFANLRRNHWDVTDEAYLDSFLPAEGKKPEDSLKAIGDMGFSGSVCSHHLLPLPLFHNSLARMLIFWYFISDILRYRRPEVPCQICAAPF